MIENELLSSQGRYVSLYRRYRPLRFEEVVGQDAAVSVLRHSLEGGTTVHAYLFSGPRGCGKTSLARILSKALNCTDTRTGAEPCGACPSCLAITAGDSLDVVEIDGASNRGIDEVRELKAHVSLAPFSSRRKIYIVDEVHMLTEPAFNALLKTLEDKHEELKEGLKGLVGKRAIASDRFPTVILRYSSLPRSPRRRPDRAP